VPAPDGPVLLLGAGTLELLGHVFDGLEDIFTGAHTLRWRHVRWGPEAESVTMPAPAIVMRESELVEALWSARARGVATAGCGRWCTRRPWVLSARGRDASAARARLSFGRRRMISAEFETFEHIDETSAWIETTPGGWIFMAPMGQRRACVQAMVADEPVDALDRLLAMVAATRDVRRHVAAPLAGASVFAAAPSLAEPPCEPGLIAVGDEAMSLDPICGDGVGHAVRGALLAAATVGAIARGLGTRRCLEHYRTRLETVVARHVRACQRYYAAADLAECWAGEQEHAERALAVVESRLARGPACRLALRGVTLVPVGSAQR